MTLNELKQGQSATIISVGGHGSLRQHFLDMGLIPTTGVKLVKFAPLGDPMELIVRGYNLSLRLADAAKIEIRMEDPVEGKPEPETRKKWLEEKEHPGFGEEGRYHSKTDSKPLPKGTLLTFALAGNQNCGKTTLFNHLTGMNQHVGNFPGVTVDRKSGQILNYPDTLVTDLPGIYSLSPYSAEEIVTRKYLIDERPKAIINIVDASNIERNLFLTMQLMELGVPMVLALNMIDEVRSNGGVIKVNTMESMLGIPVLPISARNNEGINELIQHAVHIAKYQECPGRMDFCDKNEFGGSVHRCLHGIMHLIEDHALDAGIPVRFAASKISEGDTLVMDALNLSENERVMIEHIVQQMETERGLDRASAIADMRYSFISRLCSETVVKPHESVEHRRSHRIDRILTGRYTSIPVFLLMMFMVFWLTFDVVGGWLQELLETGIESFTRMTDTALSSVDVSPTVHSLVIDGIFGGVGSVLSFVPIIVVLFFFLSLLEDTGYMARVAFVMDKPLRKLGLSGRSIVPLLIGFGCSVPAVMASRTLPSARDRKLTVLLTPFMSCTAKLPIYALISAAFFPGMETAVMTSLYLGGIFVGIFMALVSKRTRFRSEAAPFVMELPNYRLPSFENVGRLLWDKARDFLHRAFTLIFIASIVIWFLQYFDFTLNPVKNSEDSMLASIASMLVPVFSWTGFADWRLVTALIAGFMAKESVVSTMTVLVGSTVALTSIMTPASAASFLVFCLLYTPCVATIASIKRELGYKWAILTIIVQCILAWIFAAIVFYLL